MAIGAEETRGDHPRWRIASLILATICLAATACDRGQPADQIRDASAVPQARSAALPSALPSARDEPALPKDQLTERRERRSDSLWPDEDRALTYREPEREPADPTRVEEERWEAVRNLEDGRLEARVDAAESLYPDDEGIAALTAAVTDDPEPAVRVAAAESLGHALEDPAALAGLLRALDDPDPEVVVAALDSIEFVGDHTVIRELQFLLEHPNAEVREATVDAIGWLEE